MSQSAPFTYQTPDHLLSVTTESSGIQTIVRLFRDGDLVAEQRGMDSNVTLRTEESHGCRESRSIWRHLAGAASAGGR